MTMTSDQKLVSTFYEKIGNKINGHLTDVVDGPVVPNFILTPDDKSKLTTILKIARENNIHIAFNNKQINVQIPKETRQMVLLEKLQKSKYFKETKAVLPMIMGVDTFGNIMINDLSKMPHILIAGKTGCGKSVFLNSVLKTLKSKLSPSECKFIIIDPKGVDYDDWDGEKHLLCPTVKMDADASIQKLQDVLQMMDTRYQKLHDNKVKNIEEYKKKTHKKDMPYVVVVIDEFADLMCAGKKQTEIFVQEITNKARAVGIHLIIATQRPDKDVLTGIINANIPTKISFRLRIPTDSVRVLGEMGCETLLPYGDALFSEAGRIPVRVHTPI